jgi:hypothetical protein
VRSNIDVTVTKDFEVGLDLSIREKATQTPQGGAGGEVGSLASTSPLQEAYIGGDYRYPGEGWSHLNPAARVLSPGYRKYKADVASGTLRAKYNIPFVSGLALDGFLSIVKTVDYTKQFNYVWPYYERAPDGSIVQKQSRSVEDIGLREDFKQSLRTTGNVKLSYTKSFAKDHKVAAFVAYEQMSYDDNNFWAQRLGYDSPLIDQLFAGSTNRLNWNTVAGPPNRRGKTFSAALATTSRRNTCLVSVRDMTGRPFFRKKPVLDFSRKCRPAGLSVTSHLFQET